MRTTGLRAALDLPIVSAWMLFHAAFVLVLMAATVEAAPSAGHYSPAVDLELVLAVDVSASISASEQRLQRLGYVEAFRSSEVIKAMSEGASGRIAVAYVEWAGPAVQSLALGWTVLDGEATARAFAARLESLPLRREFDTSIAGALAFSAALFTASPFFSERRIIDISANGPNNTGPPVAPARDAVIASGITINGLPIMTKIYWSGGLYSIEGLDFYFEDCVIGGPGAFVVAVRRSDEFKEAIRRKLMLEIADRGVPLVAAAARLRPPHMDCLAGEHNSGRLLPAR
jgi:hypothetical protein